MRDPLADYPTFDPSAADNPPLPGQPPTALAVVEANALTADYLRKKLKEMAAELLTAPPARCKQLSQDIVRHRAASKLLNEADTGESDPDTYKELSMLNRMLAGEQDLDDPTGDEALQNEAEALLKARGIDPDVARRLMRAFEALSVAREDVRGPEAGADPPAERGRRRTSH